MVDLPLPDLAFLRIRLTYRLLDDAILPEYKGGMLRGGFGYAFQRATCPQPCWGQAEQCGEAMICPYRWVFETPHPAGEERFHDLRDVPRPFVIDLPNDRRTRIEAGESLEFGLTLIGRGIEYLPFFLFGFVRFGEMGLGIKRAQAVLEQAATLNGWSATGTPLYRDGVMLADSNALPLIDRATVKERAAALPDDLRLTIRSPLRIKHQGAFLQQIDPAAIVRAICWRLSVMSIFHGSGPWDHNYRDVVSAAEAVHVERAEIRWEDWDRTSDHDGTRRRMTMGGIVGHGMLRGVPPAARQILVIGELMHAGKACVFGHGAYRIEPA
ncbi:MAG: CRISPR system precrRNA processing endoribonuclease RAMP protein Cas6 [Oscillochloris sp.]|nr:CRISPR system precrRNA processing endoribonuclease RAMP protein Cas6 [Oscillochloris sp.]